MYRIFIFFALFFAVCTPAWSAESPAPDWKKLAAEAVAQKYPDAPSVLLWDDQKMTYQPDGTAVTDDDYYEKILTEAGREQKRVFSATYHSVYEKFELQVLEIFKQDGSCVPVDVKRTGKTAIEATQMSMNIYDPSVLVYSVALPSLQIGDVIHIRTRTREIKPRVPGKWSSMILLQSDAPVLYYSVTVNAPAARPLQAYAVKDEVSGTMTFSEKKAGDRIFYRWVARNVPSLVPEPDMPSLGSCAQRLLVSTARNWSEIASWYAKLCAPRMAALSLELVGKIDELTQNCQDDEARVQALFQYVSQQVRYMGVTAEKEAPGYEPHDVSATFARRHGVCRDKAALLAAMLRKAGFKAYPVLFYAGDPKDPDVPNLFFNHAIVAWEKNPGEYQLMDPTFESTREFFPAFLSNQSYLIAKEGEKLRRSPIIPAEKNALEIKSSAQLDIAGNMTGKIRMTFGGVNDLAYRSILSCWTLDQQRQFWAGHLKKALPGAELTRMAVWPEDVRNMSVPLQVELSFRCPQVLVRRLGAQLLALPEFYRHFGMVNYLIRAAKLEKRKFAYRPDTACQVREEWSLQLAPLWFVQAVPEVFSAGTPGVLMQKREIRQDKQLLSGKNLLSLESVDISPVQYGKVKESLRQAAAAEKALPVIAVDMDKVEKTAVKSLKGIFSSVVFEKKSEVTLEDAHNWKVKTTLGRRILSYAGVKEFSELRFSYNPVWERLQVSAYVLSNGRRYDVDSKEVNRMDAPWVASAPRYPAERVLVLSLPHVVPGCDIHYTVSRTFRDRPFFSLEQLFQEHQPLLHQTLSVTMPEKLFFRSSPEEFMIEKSEQHENDRVTVRYSSRNIAVTPKEPAQPPLAAFVPSVAISAGSYAALSAKMKNFLEQKLQLPAPETEKLARKLGPDIRKIRDYVAREIREAGPAFNALPMQYLSGPDATLAAGYGNSADRAILLMRLLRYHKIPAEFVAASDIPYLSELLQLFRDYPRNGFSSLLVWLPEQMIYLNDTDEFAPLGCVAHEEKIGMALKNGRLLMIMPSLRHESRERENYRIDLQDSGRALVSVEKLLFGMDAARMHSEFAQMTPERKKQYFESWASSFSQASVVPGSEESDFSVYPARIRCQFQVEHMAVPSSREYWSLVLPEMAQWADIVSSGGSRKTPYMRAEPYRSTKEYAVSLPAQMKVVFQRDRQTVRKYAEFARFQENIHVEPNKIELLEHLELKPCIQEPVFFEQMLQLQRFLEHPSFGRLLLYRIPDISLQKEKK